MFDVTVELYKYSLLLKWNNTTRQFTTIKFIKCLQLVYLYHMTVLSMLANSNVHVFNEFYSNLNMPQGI